MYLTLPHVHFRAERCPPIPIVLHSDASTVNTTFGSIVQYECHKGYELPDNESSISVECEQGKWNVSGQHCQGEANRETVWRYSRQYTIKLDYFKSIDSLIHSSIVRLVI